MNARSEHKTWGEALVGRALELRLCALGSGLWALGSGLWALCSRLGSDLFILKVARRDKEETRIQKQ